MVTEQRRSVMSGYGMLVILFLLQGALLFGLVQAIIAASPVGVILAAIASLVTLVMWFGFFMVHPNEAKVLQLFGKYAGSAYESGLRWANPFYAKMAVSVRVRNFESSVLKVNDSSGNPIEIAAVVVWRVVDTAEAVFEVDDYGSFVHIQSEAALRNLTNSYPYEAHNEGEVALRSDPMFIAERLKEEVQERLEQAGMEVIEARISHLAYAQEIASAMLKRQQAQAIVSARRTIVDGAVGMVKMALEQIDEHNIVELDDERKAAMVSNLLVVLCGEENAQPVLNTGSLYS
jgi:hypothetical protein